MRLKIKPKIHKKNKLANYQNLHYNKDIKFFIGGMLHGMEQLTRNRKCDG